MKYRIIKWNLPSGTLFSLEEKDGFFGSWEETTEWKEISLGKYADIRVTFLTEQSAEDWIRKKKPLKEVVKEIK